MEDSRQPLSEETRAAIQRYFENLNADLCPFCQAKIEEEQQVGRCVYAKPCGHRLYQGRAKTEKKTWKEHPYFQEGRDE